MWLRSRDRERVLAVLRRDEELTSALIPHVIPLLAWDPVADDAIRALRNVAPTHVGALADALLDSYEDFAVRRRIPRVMAVCTSQRAVDSLLLGLEDIRFEVRFQCGRALAAIVAKQPDVRIDAADVFDVVQKEVAVGRPVWEGRRLLDRLDDGESATFVDEFIRSRASQSLAHVFTMLSLVLPAEPLQIALRGLHVEDQNLRGTALEYLESVLPPAIREPLWPFLEDRRPAGRTVRPREEILADLVRSNHSIMLNLEEIKRRRLKRRSVADPRKDIMLKQGCPSSLANRRPRRAVADDRFARHLPEDLVTEQLGRLALFSLIGMVLWTIGLVIDQLVMLTDAAPSSKSRGQGPRPRSGRHHRLGADVRVRALRAHSPETKTNVGLGYMILNAAAIAALNTWVAPPPLQGADGSGVVDCDPAARLFDGAPASPGKMLGGVARCGVARSARRLACASARRAECRRLFRLRAVLAELRVRGPGDDSVAVSAPRRAQAAQGARAGQLRAGQAARARRHGRGVGSKHRLLARRAAVKLVRPELLGAGSDAEARWCSSDSSARRRPLPRSAHRTPSRCSTSASPTRASSTTSWSC